MEIQVHELSESQLNELSDMIVAKMMKSQESKRKQIRSNAYHNTMMLLRNYKKLKAHCQIVEAEVEEEFGTMWNEWRFANETRRFRVKRVQERSARRL